MVPACLVGAIFSPERSLIRAKMNENEAEINLFFTVLT